jgi:hypothetical protein
MIANVLDENWSHQEAMRGILRTFVDYLKHKYRRIQIEGKCVCGPDGEYRTPNGSGAMERPTRQADHIGRTEKSGTQRGRR